jgi:hypothetical protein
LTTITGATNDSQPSITGIAKSGSDIVDYVTLYDGPDKIGFSYIGNVDGSFTVKSNTFLSNGAHFLYVTASDLFDNESLPSNALGFIVDTIQPRPPTITSSNIGVTKLNQPTITGAAEANCNVTLYIYI